MNILLIGGSGSFINNLIIKLNKEGHRVYLLTGSRFDRLPYQKVFERYNFSYDCSSLSEIFESVNPDLSIFMGAYDTNFNWKNEEKEAVRFSSSLMNILMAYAVGNGQRFIYLSSNDVYENSFEEDITEDFPMLPKTIKGMALAQAEELCDNYRKSRNLDVVTLRISNVFGIPDGPKDVNDICTKMVLEAMDKNTITVNKDTTWSVTYQTDAVESIYKVVATRDHKNYLYNVAADNIISEQELAECISEYMEESIDIRESDMELGRRVMANDLFESEFGNTFFCDMPAVIQKIVNHMNKNRKVFLYGEEEEKPWYKKLMDKGGWFIKALIPFVENLLVFALVFVLSYFAIGSKYFAELDLFLLYVLLFAIVYGQQQATFSATISVFGYIATQMHNRTGFEVMLDTNTYLWIAQLFILGLTVGYMRDYTNKLKREQETETDFLTVQLRDIKDINTSSVRVKDALETEIVNQNDSVGKIYKITSLLEQYSPEEVLFYAAETIGRLMKSKDVAIYVVSNSDYARLFSYTSNKAREMGNSIRFTDMGEYYETIKARKVFINRKLDDRFPLMSNAIYDEAGDIQMLIMIWSIPWESMTLGQANQLVVVSSLIQSAVIRANKYLQALEEQRYIKNTKTLSSEAFGTLLKAYIKAKKRGLADCVVLRVYEEKGMDPEVVSEDVGACLRNTDYVGRIQDKKLYILLPNANREAALVVSERIAAKGYRSAIMEV